MGGKAFQRRDDLAGVERWIVDLVRVGASGNAAGVRQLANRLARDVPGGIHDPELFRAAISEALSEGVARATRMAPRTSPRDLVREATAKSLPRDADSTVPLALLQEPGVDALAPILPSELTREFESIVRERQRASQLRGASLEPTRSVLIAGPPGSGKTMAAAYLAATLELPLLTIDLASVMSSYLGKTGQNLRAALEYGRTHECVVFIDEFDALAKRRDDMSDIGELKRLVNVLLLELDRWPSSSLLIAATNHPELLDRAIERRFDRLIHLPLPGEAERQAILDRACGEQRVAPVILTAIAEASDGASGSDLVSAVQAAARSAVLNDDAFSSALITEAARRFAGFRGSRDNLIAVLHKQTSMSNREIAALVGVSHPTVSAALRRVEVS